MAAPSGLVVKCCGAEIVEGGSSNSNTTEWAPQSSPWGIGGDKVVILMLLPHKARKISMTIMQSLVPNRSTCNGVAIVAMLIRIAGGQKLSLETRS